MKTCILQVNIDDDRPLINFCTFKVKEWSESNDYDYVCVDTLSSWAARFPRLPYNFQKFQSFYDLRRDYDRIIHLDSDILPFYNPTTPKTKGLGLVSYYKPLYPKTFSTYYDCGVIIIENINLIELLYDFYDFFLNDQAAWTKILKLNDKNKPLRNFESLFKSFDTGEPDEFLFNVWAHYNNNLITEISETLNYKPLGCGYWRNRQSPIPNSLIHFAGKEKELGYNNFINWATEIESFYGSSNFTDYPRF